MNPKDVEQGETYSVRCVCPRLDDLKPEAFWWIGRTFTAKPAWIIEHGDYAGQWAWTPTSESCKEAGENTVGWFPGCDIEVVEWVEWRA